LYRPDGLAHVAIIATGALVVNALRAAKDLDKKGIRAVVANIHTIKPIDTELLIQLAKEAKAIVSVKNTRCRRAWQRYCRDACKDLSDADGIHRRTGSFWPVRYAQELIEKYGMGTDAIITAVMKYWIENSSIDFEWRTGTVWKQTPYP